MLYNAGLTDIASALRRSVSVRRVEFPGCDAAAGGRGASERVAALWRDLHERCRSFSLYLCYFFKPYYLALITRRSAMSSCHFENRGDNKESNIMNTRCK